jgi:penicillin-binding protein 1A
VADHSPSDPELSRDLPLRPATSVAWSADQAPAAGTPPGGAAAAPPAARVRVPRWLVWALASVVLGALSGIAVAAAIHMPRVESLDTYTPSLITQLLDAHGEVFATFARERRVLLAEGEVPALLANAVVAAEDRRFFQHGGIDPVGIVRAATVNWVRGRRAQGASTLTMQLARELFLTRDKNWRRKIEEALLAVELEKRYSKQQLLTLYLNLVNLGHGNYGMASAAKYYFGKSVDQLTAAEAATLAGIPQRPSEYSPYRRPDLVLRRRDYVLDQMLEAGFLDRQQHAEALATPLLVLPRRQETNLGPYFAEDVRRHLEAAYGETRLYEAGLQVRTTLDAQVQRAAEDSLRKGLLALDHRRGYRGPHGRLTETDLESHVLPSWSGVTTPVPGTWYEGLVLETLPGSARIRIGSEIYPLAQRGIEWTGKRDPADLLHRGDIAWVRFEVPAEEAAAPYLVLEQEPKLEAALIVLESATGAVRAMVGGWDFERSKFNRASQARRQVGSAFKPFVFAAAIEAGWTAADTLFDGPAVFLGADGLPSYSPRNYYRKYYGIITLRRALEQSVNVTSVKLLDLVGVERVVDFARRAGIRSDLPPYPALALGTPDLVPMELAAAYAAIANGGVYLQPYLIEQVASPDGKVLERHTPRAVKTTEASVAYVLTHMLEGVVDRGTAAAKAGKLETALAGKTGTTDDYSDAWFVGYTPRYTILTWVGYDQKRPIGRKMTGAEAALPMWVDLVSRGLEAGWIQRGQAFPVPPGVTQQAIEYYTGLLPGPGAERIIEEAFVAGTQPTRSWEPRWAGIVQLPYFQQRGFYVPKEGERMPDAITDWALVQSTWQAKEEGDG